VPEPPALISYIDTINISSDIRVARGKGADQIVIFVHWGTEYDTIPDRQQIMTADAMIRGGADMIIGSHPHVLQPMIMKEDSSGRVRPIVWSMGNLVSNQRIQRRDGGAMIITELTNTGGKTHITYAGYILTWVYTPVKNGKRMFYILPCSQYENYPDFFPLPSDYDRMMLYVNIARRLLQNNNNGFNELIYSDGIWLRRPM
jgi:poly-gamma-glutamate synthesis protein (capsule biosynthesis protein)